MQKTVTQKTVTQKTVAQKILIIEDEAVVALELEEHLRAMGYRVVGPAASYAEAMDAVAKEPPDLVLADRRIIGDVNGIETGARICQQHGCRLVVLTAQSDRISREEAISRGASAILFKPFDVDILRRTIDAVFAV